MYAARRWRLDADFAGFVVALFEVFAAVPDLLFFTLRSGSTSISASDATGSGAARFFPFFCTTTAATSGSATGSAGGVGARCAFDSAAKSGAGIPTASPNRTSRASTLPSTAPPLGPSRARTQVAMSWQNPKYAGGRLP